jgi:hypothetical protein
VETPQPPHVSVSGSIVIEGHLAALSSSPTEESAPEPQPRPPWWNFWKWPRETVSLGATVVLSAATFGLALATTILAINSNRQIEEARMEFETNERPWLYSHITVDGPLSFNKDGGKLPITIEVHNAGKTPGTDVFLDGLIIVDEPEQSFVPSAAANTALRHCVASRGSQGTSPQTRLSFFPKEYAKGPFSGYIKRDEIDKTKRLQQGMIRNPLGLVFCVDYKFTYTKDRHLTAELATLESDAPPPFAMNENDPAIVVKATFVGTYAD